MKIYVFGGGNFVKIRLYSAKYSKNGADWIFLSNFL